MSNRFTPFPYLAHERPEIAKEKLFDALISSGGNIEKAHQSLGLSSFTWYRYIRILGIKETMRSMMLSFKNPDVDQQYSDERYVPKKTVLG